MTRSCDSTCAFWEADADFGPCVACIERANTDNQLMTMWTPAGCLRVTNERWGRGVESTGVRCGTCARKRGVTDTDKRLGIPMCECVTMIDHTDYLMRIVVGYPADVLVVVDERSGRRWGERSVVIDDELRRVCWDCGCLEWDREEDAVGEVTMHCHDCGCSNGDTCLVPVDALAVWLERKGAR